MAAVEWIKVATDIFDNEKIKLIESMPNGYALITVWFKMLCLAGKQNNGGVFTIGKAAYTEAMLATVFRMKESIVKTAIDTFEQFGMIEIENEVISLPSWQKHQNIDGLDKIREKDRERKRAKRAQQKAEAGLETSADVSADSPQTSEGCPRIEEEGEEEIDIFHSFTLSDADANEENVRGQNDAHQLKAMQGNLGQGLVMLSEEQNADLLERLSLDEYNKYVGIVAECEKSGKRFKNKTHYQAILDMVAKDRRVTPK